MKATDGDNRPREVYLSDTRDAHRCRTPHSQVRCGAFAGEHLDSLTRQQQRIMDRSALLAYVIAAETRSGQSLALGEALRELLTNISEAARTIGTILQQVVNGAPTADARTPSGPTGHHLSY